MDDKLISIAQSIRDAEASLVGVMMTVSASVEIDGRVLALSFECPLVENSDRYTMLCDALARGMKLAAMYPDEHVEPVDHV